MSIQDQILAIMHSFPDGMNVGSEKICWMDKEHANKIAELMAKNDAYLYAIQKAAGLNPFDESYYGPDTDLFAINPDHFLIKGRAVDRIPELRKIVYDAIDKVYDNPDNVDWDTVYETFGQGW